MFDVVLAGSNLAVIVAALELAQLGQRVLFASDGKAGGGHFAGLRVDGYAFDIGMVLLEKTASVLQSDDLGSYDPAKRNDCARFFGLVSTYLDRHLETRRAPCLEVRFRGGWYPDFILSNRLDFLAEMPSRDRLLVELEAASPKADLHASNKATHALYDTLEYSRASRFNHGASLHKHCFEPLCRKILGVSSDRLLARYHRLGWLPLYYPETLASSLREGRPVIDEYPYWTTADGFVGALVECIYRRLIEHPNINLLETQLEAISTENGVVRVRDNQGRCYFGTRLVLGLAAERVAQLCGLLALPKPAGVTLIVVLGLVRREAIRDGKACVLIADHEYAAYRITDQDALAGLNPPWHRVSIEANLEFFQQRYPQGGDFAKFLAEELVRLGLIVSVEDFRTLKALTVCNALPLPTAELLTIPACPQGLGEKLPGTELTGNLLGFGVASMNDQIIQGLKVARLWGVVERHSVGPVNSIQV